MRVELKQLQEEAGITFVFVTHDQEEALTMSDRITVMSAGGIQQVGTPHEIYEKPRNRFVADFIGETNLLDVTVEEVSGAGAACVVSRTARGSNAKRRGHPGRGPPYASRSGPNGCRSRCPGETPSRSPAAAPGLPERCFRTPPRSPAAATPSRG